MRILQYGPISQVWDWMAPLPTRITHFLAALLSKISSFITRFFKETDNSHRQESRSLHGRVGTGDESSATNEVVNALAPVLTNSHLGQPLNLAVELDDAKLTQNSSQDHTSVEIAENPQAAAYKAAKLINTDNIFKKTTRLVEIAKTQLKKNPQAAYNIIKLHENSRQRGYGLFLLAKELAKTDLQATCNIAKQIDNDYWKKQVEDMI